MLGGGGREGTVRGRDRREGGKDSPYVLGDSAMGFTCSGNSGMLTTYWRIL